MPPFSRIKVRASVPSFAMAKGGNREMTGEEGGEKERERERIVLGVVVAAVVVVVVIVATPCSRNRVPDSIKSCPRALCGGHGWQTG